MSGEPVVALASVAKTYEGSRPVIALHPCTVEINSGELVAIIGPSGSGKSTLLNVLGLLDEPSAGEYRLDGAATTTLSERGRCAARAHRIGFVFQSFHLVAYRSAVENVEAGLLYHRIGRRERRARSIEMLQRVGLETRMWATPSELSGGERQRVALARAVVRRPSLLLCDEPTGNLDSQAGEQVLSVLDELHDDGLTVVIVTHNPGVAARTRRIIELRDGLIHRDTPRPS